MSDMYAIKGTTLTALGDAVRSKIIGTAEVPNLIVENQEIADTRAYPVSLQGATYIKVKGQGKYINPNSSRSYHGLGYAPGDWMWNEDAEIRASIDYVILHQPSTDNPGKDFEFEFVVNTNKFAFVTLEPYETSKRLNASTITYEVVAVDENGNEYKYTPLEMVDVVNELKTVSAEALTITGDCSNRFSNNGWNWFIDSYGDKIKTKDISTAGYMFQNSHTLSRIPFDINITNKCSNISQCFDGCGKLEEVPYIIGPAGRALPTSAYSGTISYGKLFQNCSWVREIPEDYFWKIVPEVEFWNKLREVSTQGCASMFQNCYSLRKLPDISMIGSNGEGYYNCIYASLCYQCFVLDEITNLQVICKLANNAFSGITKNCYRLKNFTFEVNADGTPKTAEWKAQTLDFSDVGSAIANTNILNYNSGITADKQVKDDASYAALKDDADWFTVNIAYSRYNHDSAVATINSLPDCSATGTNTIKFKGAAGSLTDGGAINTLTEAEIAVAAAKGWTVSFT